jgi:isopentenyl diphosphate isomerase/L-lactate dehydrogenase-like FMN-dependent dehydrogenase
VLEDPDDLSETITVAGDSHSMPHVSSALLKQANLYREKAERARRLAEAVNHEPTLTELGTYVAEMEDHATELEAQISRLKDGADDWSGLG